MLLLHATVPSLLMAWRLQSAFRAKTSATPVELGTAGTILETPEPSPGLDQITVPARNALVTTVTSAEAFPAVIVAFPEPTAVMIGGSSVESIATAVLLEVQDRPVTDCPVESSA